jgi:hypothetical protein
MDHHGLAQQSYMLDHRELLGCLGGLGLDSKPVIAHASFSAFRGFQGGAKAFLQALLGSVGALVMPTFTYKIMVTLESSPPNNGVIYGGDRDANRMVQPFHPALPADPLMGLLPETLRCHPFANGLFTLFSPLPVLGQTQHWMRKHWITPWHRLANWLAAVNSFAGR